MTKGRAIMTELPVLIEAGGQHDAWIERVVMLPSEVVLAHVALLARRKEAQPQRIGLDRTAHDHQTDRIVMDFLRMAEDKGREAPLVIV